MADALIDSQVPAKSGGAGMLKKSFPGLSFLDNLSEMTMLRQIGLLVGLAASVAIGFAVVLWSQQPDYKPLYGSLNGVDANRVVEALTAADIPYKVEPNSGALLVKADDLGRARMKVASAGVAPTDTTSVSRSSTRNRRWAPASSWKPPTTAAAWKASWRAPCRA